MRRKRVLSMAVIALINVGAWAEETRLDEIVLSADKTGSSTLLELPSSVSVVSSDQVNDFSIKDSIGLQSMTSNFLIVETGPATASTFASMRGITAGMIGTPSVGFYVDDVYYSALDMNFLDIDHIEVLKGPQGTLYGRNSEAGIVNVVTKVPSFVPGAEVGMEYGSFNTISSHAIINQPLNDTTTLRAALRYEHSDGYFEDTLKGDDVGEEKNIDARLKLYTKVNDDLSVSIGYNYQKSDSPSYAQYAPWSSETIRKNVDVDYLGDASKEIHDLHVKMDYTYSDALKIVSITSAKKEHYVANNDIDFTAYDLTRLYTDKEVKSLSEELRFIANPNERLQWINGIFLLKEEEKHDYRMPMNFMNMGMGMPAETLVQKSKINTLGTALFSEATYGFENSLQATMGLRYDREKKEDDYTQRGGTMLSMFGYEDKSGSASETFDAWLPKVSLAYKQYEAFSPYVTISKGFRSGGFNTTDTVGKSYEPELTWNYELGVKSKLSDTLSFSTALFYIDWKDMQVELAQNNGVAYIDNASSAKSKGAEIELHMNPMDGLNLFSGLGYTKATYEEYTKGSSDYSGHYVINSPRYTFNVGANYLFEGGYYVGGNYAYFGKVYYDNDNTHSQSYGVTNVKIGYEHEKFDVYLYAKNLFDEGYITRAFVVNSNWYARAGEPRSVGLAFAYRF
ncbi:MAG: TonB-dependent receptor [Epsilonproteobacteria bacterium]|nr:TonB-dependent receptor [Campylobacterota bacterium]